MDYLENFLNDCDFESVEAGDVASGFVCGLMNVPTDTTAVTQDNTSNVDQIMKSLTEKLTTKVVAQPARVKCVAPVVRIRPGCDNLLVKDNLVRFKDEVPAVDNDMFTMPVSTTNTIEGLISNVTFHEEELIKRVVPCSRVVGYKCNYGAVWWPQYVPPVAPPKSSRGRKKMVRPKKQRKQQGQGGEFSSQMTCVVISLSGRLYKIKLFRNGRFQLPGIKTELIDEVLECISVVEDKINTLVAHDISYLMSIHVVMRNYKMRAKLPPRAMVNFARLNDYLLGLKKSAIVRGSSAPNILPMDSIVLGETASASPIDLMPMDEPKIVDVIYNRLRTKLSIIIATPSEYNPGKTLRVNVFLYGKINILGALDMAFTQSVCRFLYRIFHIGGFIVTPPQPVTKKLPVCPRLWVPEITELCDRVSGEIASAISRVLEGEIIPPPLTIADAVECV